MIKKFNEFFICDADEEPSESDYFFHGFIGLCLIIFIFVIIGLGKGV